MNRRPTGLARNSYQDLSRHSEVYGRAFQPIDRDSLLRAANVAPEWANHIPCGAGLEGRDQWYAGIELNPASINPEAQVGPELERGRDGRHSSCAEHDTVEPADHGEVLYSRVLRFRKCAGVR